MRGLIKHVILIFMGALTVCFIQSHPESDFSTISSILDLNTSDIYIPSNGKSIFSNTIKRSKWPRSISEEGFLCYAHCHCTQDSISCKHHDTIDSLGPLEEAASFKKIYIERLQYFVRLRASDLSEFVNLEELVITKSGLEFIEEDAFENNQGLKFLDLRSNQLAATSWKFFQYINPETQIILDNNPMTCSCSGIFLMDYIIPFSSVNEDYSYDGDYDDYDPDKAFCLDGVRRKHNLTSFPESINCSLPQATIKENITITDASEVTITCKGIPSNDHSLKVNWRRFKRQDETELFFEAKSNSEVSMFIRNLDALSSGTYFCDAKNENGVHTVQWDLLVLSSPKIKRFEKHDLYPEVALIYEIVGYPIPSISWFKDGKKLSFDTRTEEQMHKMVQSKPYLVSGSLYLNAPLHFGGNYTLSATNDYGGFNITQAVDDTGGKAPLRHGDNSALTYRTSSNGNSTLLSAKMILVVIASAIAAVFVVVCGFLAVRKFFPTSCEKFNRKQPASCKTRKNLLFKEKKFERVRRNRLAGLCLSSSQSNRPVCRENIPLSIDHVVQNPNYEKGDDSIRSGHGFEHGGFLDERSLPAVPVIPSTDIECLHELGEGAFGLVYLGTLKTKDQITLRTLSLPVAIKTVKDCQFENNKRDFDREAMMLFGLKHANIVTLYGVSIDQQPHMIVLEYMEFGDLCNFLRTNGPDKEILIQKLPRLVIPRPTLKRPLTSFDLLAIAVQIAKGAAYLAQQHFVHRDLATRNCLVGADLVVKIGDFGMSRDIYATDYYKVGSNLLMPVRWMPPESIVYRTFTIESDVWSFGVVLWEIYSFGKQPWYELSNSEVIQHVQQGNVMTCPSGCPPDVYGLMLKCWHKDPRERISMEKMFNQLDSLLQQNLGIDSQQIPHFAKNTTCIVSDCVQHQMPKSSQHVLVPSYLELIDG